MEAVVDQARYDHQAADPEGAGAAKEGWDICVGVDSERTRAPDLSSADEEDSIVEGNDGGWGSLS